MTHRRQLIAATIGLVLVIVPYAAIVVAGSLEPVLAYPIAIVLAIATAGATWVAADDPPEGST
jgi:hypothetical protein